MYMLKHALKVVCYSNTDTRNIDHCVHIIDHHAYMDSHETSIVIVCFLASHDIPPNQTITSCFYCL